MMTTVSVREELSFLFITKECFMMTTVLVREELSFDDLEKKCWAGAIRTLDIVSDNNKENDLMEFLSNVFIDGATLTEINDFLWFEDTEVFDYLNIKDEDEDE